MKHLKRVRRRVTRPRRGRGKSRAGRCQVFKAGTPKPGVEAAADGSLEPTSGCGRSPTALLTAALPLHRLVARHGLPPGRTIVG